MTKIIVAAFLIVSFLSAGCAAPRRRSNRRMLSSLRKINDELNQKVQHLENEIRVLKLSGGADVSKAKLLKEHEALKKKYNDAVNLVQGNDQNVKQLKEGNDRMEFELIDVKNEVMALQKKNGDLNALVAKLSEQLKEITKARAAPPAKASAKAEVKKAVSKPKPAEVKTSPKPPKKEKPAPPPLPSIEKMVGGLVGKWKSVWEKKDIKGYLAFYSKRFLGINGYIAVNSKRFFRRNMNLNAWSKYKTKNFQSKKSIDLNLTDMKTKKEKNDEIVVTFFQNYNSNNYKDDGIKTLRWTKEKDGWKIVNEKWAPKN